VAAGNPNTVLRAPGRLSINPNDLSAAYPHGGTALGVVASAFANPNFTTEPVFAEEFAEAVDVVYLGQSWVFGARLRNVQDGDVLGTMFPNTSAGGSGTKIIDHPGTVGPGTLLSSRSVILLFTPRDVTSDALLIYRALPLVEATARLAFSALEELAFPVIFRAIRNTSGKSIALGKLGDLTL